MRLTLRGEYALRALLVLGLHPPDEVVRIQLIADQQRIPKRFLEQILNDLKEAGVVESRRGVQGGYRLARAPRQISLAEVIRHIDGPLAPISCVSERFYEPCTCPDEARCGIRDIMRHVRDAFAQLLEGISLEDVCTRTRALQAGGESTPGDYVI